MAKTYKKLQVFTKTTDFQEATKIVDTLLEEPQPEEIRIRHIYAAVNATDVNYTAAKYEPNAELPFDIGMEVSRPIKLMINGAILISRDMRTIPSDNFFYKF